MMWAKVNKIPVITLLLKIHITACPEPLFLALRSIIGCTPLSNP
jgi:hypothetical protein